MNRSVSIVHQLPDFVKSDYPVFVQFLKAYYDWIETEYSAGRIQTLTDIDATTDDFLKYFRKSLDVYGITANKAERLYLKHIKELYNAKGSDQGFSLFFKILYDKLVTTFEPWLQVLIPSDAQWVRTTSIFVEYDTTLADSLIHNQITLTEYAADNITVVNQYNALVQDVRSTSSSTVTELIVTDFFIKSVPSYFVITHVAGLEVTAIDVLDMPTSATVTASDGNFKVGQCFDIDDMTIRVKAVDDLGYVKYVEIVKFSVEWASYLTSSATVTHENGVDQFTVNFDRSYKCVYPGFYETTANTLGDQTYIEDLFYYQKFSYVVDVDLALEEYRDQLQKVLHPIGTRQFGNWRQKTSLTLDSSANSTQNVIVPLKPAGYKLFEPLTMTSTVTTNMTYDRSITDSITIDDNITPALYNKDDKYEQNSVATSDAGYAVVQPATGGYVDDQYWSFGYLEGEQTF